MLDLVIFRGCILLSVVAIMQTTAPHKPREAKPQTPIVIQVLDGISGMPISHGVIYVLNGFAPGPDLARKRFKARFVADAKGVITLKASSQLLTIWPEPGYHFCDILPFNPPLDYNTTTQMGKHPRFGQKRC